MPPPTMADSDDPDAHVREVHRAAAPAADALDLAHQFGHQRRERRPLADRVPVRTVRAGHVVFVAERHAGADDGRFLSGAGMAGAGNLPRANRLRDGFLEAADAQHPAQALDALRAGHGHAENPGKSAGGCTVC